MSEHEQNPGSALPDEQLEARLAGLTEWTGSTRGPFERALAATEGAPTSRAIVRAAGRRLREVAGRVGAAGRTLKALGTSRWAAAALIGAVGLAVAATMLPGKARDAAAAAGKAPFDLRLAIDRVRALQMERKYGEAIQVCDQILAAEPQNPTGLLLKDVLQGMRTYKEYARNAPSEWLGGMRLSLNNPSAEGWNVTGGDSWRDVGESSDVPALDLQSSFHSYAGLDRGEGGGGGGQSPFGEAKFRRVPEQGQSQQAPAGRQIIRRGQVDLVVAEVQVAFRRAQDLIKPERGEFVQDSVLSGSGQAMTARVVLRVDPARLAEVMQASRGLGELAAEQTGGDDVTERLTDLDAQIRNEQRVEKEMLELFDLRKDAPLKDVLELREQLARVRGTIEKLQAQKAQTERLVSLATLAITIRPQPDKTVAPPPVDETPSAGARLSRSLSDAWGRGINSLISFAGWTVEKTLGGLPTWTTLGVTGLVVWKIVRRRKAAKSPDAPPAG